MKDDRGHWGSKIGFILAASGSAIGLGNIWRFPYITGENGGAAFVIVYLIFVLLLGLPYMLAEFSLGRAFQLNTVGSIDKITNKSAWRYVGILGIITSIGILSFYGVISGWTLAYVFKTLFTEGQVLINDFSNFVNNPYYEILLYAIFLIFTALIVYKGVEAGIEKWCKILMPILMVLLIALIIYANLLPNSELGLKFYLMPDFGKINFKTIVAALGQAFFSLSLGIGLMVTFGSYLPKSTNMFSSAIYIVFFDALIALLAGFIIFPALFSMGENPASGPSLVFIIFPKLFAQMPFGNIVGAFFFVLLSIAALTSTVSLLEVPVSYFVDEKKISRKKIVWIMTIVVFVIGLPSALSQGTIDFFTNFGFIPESLTSQDFLSQISFIFGDLLLTIGALFLSIFIGWIWGAQKAAEEIKISGGKFYKFEKIWIFLIKYIIPIIVVLILISIFKVTGIT